MGLGLGLSWGLGVGRSACPPSVPFRDTSARHHTATSPSCSAQAFHISPFGSGSSLHIGHRFQPSGSHLRVPCVRLRLRCTRVLFLSHLESQSSTLCFPLLHSLVGADSSIRDARTIRRRLVKGLRLRLSASHAWSLSSSFPPPAFPALLA